MNGDDAYDAVVVVSFGGPEGPDDVIPFLENVTRGRNVPRERLAEVGEIYYVRGGVSPINELNRGLVGQLREALRARGCELPVYWGNRNWHPYLSDTAEQMRRDGVKRALAFVTSAFSSYSGCRQYLEDIEAACGAAGGAAGGVGREEETDGLEIHKLRGYFNHPTFVRLQREAVAESVASLLGQGLALESIRVIFTAHSIPLSMAAGCEYENQLRQTAQLVMETIDWRSLTEAGITEAGTDAAPHGWDLVWQSRSGPPQVKWLEPDIGDHLPAVAFFGQGPMRAGRCRGVVVVPLGFVSDHMEVVNDLDDVAAAVARDFNLRFERAATAGMSPEFAEMAADLVLERLSGGSDRAQVGPLEVLPDFCPADCCAISATPSS